jgi:hypothetical protein
VRCRCIDSPWEFCKVGDIYDYNIIPDAYDKYQLDMYYNGVCIGNMGFYGAEEFGRYFVDISVDRDRKIKEVLGE